MSYLAPVGYRGQKYQVSCLGFDQSNPSMRKVVGWTNDATGGALAKMIEAHSSWHSAVVDEVEPEIRESE